MSDRVLRATIVVAVGHRTGAERRAVEAAHHRRRRPRREDDHGAVGKQGCGRLGEAGGGGLGPGAEQDPGGLLVGVALVGHGFDGRWAASTARPWLSTWCVRNRCGWHVGETLVD
jgi:hypothetical protein